MTTILSTVKKFWKRRASAMEEKETRKAELKTHNDKKCKIVRRAKFEKKIRKHQRRLKNHKRVLTSDK